MRLIKVRKPAGNITTYHASVGCKEAREAGFIDSSGNSVELEKTIDTVNHVMTIRVKQEGK